MKILFCSHPNSNKVIAANFANDMTDMQWRHVETFLRDLIKKLLWSDKQEANYNKMNFQPNLNCERKIVSEMSTWSANLKNGVWSIDILLTLIDTKINVEEKMSNFVINSVTADGLASLGVRISAGTVMTKFLSHIPPELVSKFTDHFYTPAPPKVCPSVRPSVDKIIDSIHFIPGIYPYGVSPLTPIHFRVPSLIFSPLVAKYLAENGVSGTFWKNYWLNLFHTWHLPLWGEFLDPYTFSCS